MNWIIRTTLIVLSLSPACLVPAYAGELEDREVIARQMSFLFVTEEFAELDRLAEVYRSAESRTDSGLWKLTLFYIGLYVPRASGRYDAAYYEAIEEKYLRWTEQNPHSTVARIGYASTLISHAWTFRGHGPASEVPPEAWAPFREYLAKARLYLLDPGQDWRIDPQWYDVMLVLAKSEGWSPTDFSALVDEATERHPYYYEIYFKAIGYLLPKWYGDRALIEDFAGFAVERTREREGEGMYARIYWYVSQIQYGTELFTDTQVVWSRMAKSIDDVLVRYPDQWNINNFARFACLAGDKEKTRELVARVVGRPMSAVWDDREPFFERCRSWAGG